MSVSPPAVPLVTSERRLSCGLLSIVIPVRDAAATIAMQLAALSGQAYDGRWEVVVADNESCDRSRAIATSFTGRLPGLRVVDASAPFSAARARNVGAAAARGDALVFCDADDEVAPGWLAAIAAALGRHSFVASRFELHKLNHRRPRNHLEHPQSHGLNPYDYPPFLPHAGGSGLGVWRSRHERIGGFDESYQALEDTDYCWRQQLDGTPLHFVPGAVVHVRLKGDLASDFQYAARLGEWNVAIYCRYRDRGMPRLGPTAGLLRWMKLLATLPRATVGADRARWLSQLGWRWGRLRGCLKYHALAL